MSQATVCRPIRTEYKKDGKVYGQSVLSPEGFPVRALMLLLPDVIIPVVFIPGIMGSNLRLTEGGKRAWRPPNGTIEGIGEIFRSWKLDPNARKKVLDPNVTEVDDSGTVKVWDDVEHLLIGASDASTKKLAKLRGWGELHWESYGNLMNELEHKLANILADGATPHQYWRDYVMEAQGTSTFGAEKDFKPLTPDELKLFANAAYPVHAVGYNWLQSNNLSVERLNDKIESIIAFYRDTLGKHCEQVILVTHSMGGLVGRACSELQCKSDKILGVVHAVLPAIGAPATYKRMRAGFEGPAQVILGRNAAEATAVLAQSPGPLELLPTAEYFAKVKQAQRHWLLVADKTQSKMLGEGDPYDAIYLNQNDWWRLVKSELVNPDGGGGQEKPTREDIPSETSEQQTNHPLFIPDKDFEEFSKNISIARSFHDNIKSKYHPNTYAFYAADAEQPAWGEVCWKSRNMPAGDVSQGTLVEDDLNGQVKIKIGETECRFDIAGPDLPGDGTVPEASGQAPKPYVKQIFRHEGEAKGHESYNHQFCFKNNLTIGVTLYSIAKIALGSELLKGKI